MADNEAALTHHAALSTTAETFAFTEPIKQLTIINQDGTNAASVTISTGRTQAAAEAGIVTAVAAADDTYYIPPGGSVVVFKSPRATYVAGSAIAAAATPTISLHGSKWYD